jgi:uncharacterized membrane protein
MSSMPHQPDGAAFDIVLLLHVACVLAGVATTATATTTAHRLRRHAGSSAPLPESLRRYFRPGVNWAGRTVYGIPVFGFALVAMSQGAYALGDGWVLAGLVLFVLLAVIAEVAMWPAERRLQHALKAVGTGSDPAPAPAAPAMRVDAATLERSATVVLVLLVAGIVVMIAQP